MTRRKARRKARSKKVSNVTRRDAIKTMVVGASALPYAFVNISKAMPSDATMHQDYAFSMSLHVPRVFNNNESLGYRRYQTQKISGKLTIQFNASGDIVGISFCELANKTHKLANGKYVTYSVYADEAKQRSVFNAIGSNKTNVFKTASICFAMVAEPSYNIGEVEEDTSLYVTLAGKGSINKDGELTKAHGNVAGTLGCGCLAYGHVSPTRRLGQHGATDAVDDVAAVFGTWTLKLA